MSSSLSTPKKDSEKTSGEPQNLFSVIFPLAYTQAQVTVEHLETIKSFIREGADISPELPFLGKTPLEFFAEITNFSPSVTIESIQETLTLLGGTRPEFINRQTLHPTQQSAIWSAAFSGNLMVIDFLIAHGGDLTLSYPAYRSTPIHGVYLHLLTRSNIGDQEQLLKRLHTIPSNHPVWITKGVVPDNSYSFVSPLELLGQAFKKFDKDPSSLAQRLADKLKAKIKTILTIYPQWETMPLSTDIHEIAFGSGVGMGAGRSQTESLTANLIYANPPSAMFQIVQFLKDPKEKAKILNDERLPITQALFEKYNAILSSLMRAKCDPRLIREILKRSPVNPILEALMINGFVPTEPEPGKNSLIYFSCLSKKPRILDLLLKADYDLFTLTEKGTSHIEIFLKVKGIEIIFRNQLLDKIFGNSPEKTPLLESTDDGETSPLKKILAYALEFSQKISPKFNDPKLFNKTLIHFLFQEIKEKPKVSHVILGFSYLQAAAQIPEINPKNLNVLFNLYTPDKKKGYLEYKGEAGRTARELAQEIGNEAFVTKYDHDLAEIIESQRFADEILKNQRCLKSLIKMTSVSTKKFEEINLHVNISPPSKEAIALAQAAEKSLLQELEEEDKEKSKPKKKKTKKQRKTNEKGGSAPAAQEQPEPSTKSTAIVATSASVPTAVDLASAALPAESDQPPTPQSEFAPIDLPTPVLADESPSVPVRETEAASTIEVMMENLDALSAATGSSDELAKAPSAWIGSELKETVDESLTLKLEALLSSHPIMKKIENFVPPGAHIFICGSFLDSYRETPADLDLIHMSRNASLSAGELARLILEEFGHDENQMIEISSKDSDQTAPFYQQLRVKISDKLTQKETFTDVTFYEFSEEREGLSKKLDELAKKMVISKNAFYHLETKRLYRTGDSEYFEVRRNPFTEKSDRGIDFTALAVLLKEIALKNPRKLWTPESLDFLDYLKELASSIECKRTLWTNPYVPKGWGDFLRAHNPIALNALLFRTNEEKALETACSYLFEKYWDLQPEDSQRRIYNFLSSLVSLEYINELMQKLHKAPKRAPSPPTSPSHLAIEGILHKQKGLSAMKPLSTELERSAE